MAIWVPPPQAIIAPVVIEPYGLPEVYADGGIVHTGENLTETVLYRRYGSERLAVVRIVMLRQAGPPEDGFEVSLIRAYVEAMGGTRH